MLERIESNNMSKTDSLFPSQKKKDVCNLLD